MADFDSPYSDPFESLDLVDIQAKSHALSEAFDKKIEGLQIAKERQMLRQKTYQETLSGILGLDPDGAIAAPVNTVGGSLLDAGQQTVKFLGTAGIAGVSGLMGMDLNDEDYSAYSRIQQGKGTPEDFTRMKEMRQTPVMDMSAGDLFKFKENREENIEDLGQYFDSYKLRGTGNSQALQEALDTPETRDALEKLTSGTWSGTDKGKIASIIGFSKEIGALVKEAVKAGGDNPVAVLEEALVNATPIIMASVGGVAGTSLLGAYTSGYAAETYNKAVQDYQQKNGGAYPDAERREEMLLQASSLAAAEYVGSVLTAGAAGLGKLPTIAAMGARGAGKEVAESALKSMLKAGGVSIARVGSAVGSEAATEGFQTYQEGELMDDPASALKIYTGAAIGGLTGGAMATPAAVAGTVLAPAKAAAEARRIKAEEKEKRKAELAEYIATGDVSAFFDPASDKYDIRTGMEVLQVVASDASKDVDTRQAAVAKAQEMFDTLTDQRKALKKELSAEGIVETNKAEVVENLAATKEYVEQALKENPDMPIEGFNKEIARLETALTKIESPEIVEKLERLNTLTTQITETQPLLRDMDNVTTKAEVQAIEEELVPATPKAKSKTTLIRSITSTDALTPQEALELADDTENDLTDNERVYLRKFSEARISQNKLMSMERVNKTIFNGDDQFGNLSLPDYRARMAQAINAGNLKEQVKLQGMLGKWVNHHTNKLATAKAMYASLKGDNDVKYIVANEDGTWSESPRALTGKERDSSGSMEIRRNYSKNVIPVMEEENIAMQAAYQELVAMANASTTSQEAQEDVVKSEDTQAPVVGETSIEQAPEVNTPKPASTEVGLPEGTVVTESLLQILATLMAGKSQPNVKQKALRELEATYPDVYAIVNTYMQDNTVAFGKSDKRIQALWKQAKDIGVTPVTEQAEETSTVSEDVVTEAVQEEISAAPLQPEQEQVQTEELPPIPVREDMPEITRADPVEAKKSSGTLEALNAETGWGSLFVQQAPEQESPQPLLAVKDFMSQWEANPSLIFAFIEETEGTTTPEQNHAIKVFKETMKAWMPIVDTLLVEVKPEFIQDAPFMIFTSKQKDADGKDILVMEENVKAAVVAAAILHIQNEGGQTYKRTQKDINLLLGRDKDEYVSNEEFGTYQLIGDHRQHVIDNLAMSVSSLLGLDIKPDVPQQTKAIMDTALGSLVLRLLMEVGSVAQRDESISSRVDGSKADPYITFANIWGNDNYMNMRIAASSQGSNSVLHRLLGTENMVVEPTLKPQKTTQRDMQKQFQEASDKQLEHLNAINKVENFVDGFMMTIMKKLSPTGQDKVIGVQWDGGENGKYIQKTRIKGIQGANDSLRRNLQNAFTFFDTTLKGDPEKPFFLKNVPWTQGRAGIAQTVLNPNADKTARRLVTRRSWKSKIDLRNPVAVNGFMIAVASALGIDIDKMSHEKAMEDLKAELGWDGKTNGGLRLTNPIYADAIEAIRDVIYNDRDGFTPEQEKAIGLAVDANSDHMHALQALAALAEMEAKITDNADDFITTLTLEVDGVTNGPMLTMLLWGTYGDPRSLERGGFFTEEAEHENYNEWREEIGNSDLYEGNAKDMVKVITTMDTPREKEILSAAYVVTGTLVNDGKATSATRKLVKLPLTQFSFGSGMETVRETVVDSFVESMYEKLEKAVLKMWEVGGSDHDLRMLEKAINALLTDGVNNYGIDLNGKEISDNRGEFWLNFELSPKQFDVLKNNIDSTLGEAMEQTLSLNFAETLAARKAITTASSMMYSTYMAAYNYLRRLALKGANRDLTKEEEARLFERLKPMLPKMHTAYSKVSGNSMEAALPMFGKKARQVMHDDDVYKAAIKMAPFTEIKHNKTKKTMVSYGSAKIISPPSVRSAPMGIHSLDGKTSQDAQKGTEALNNHDAHLTGIEAIEIQTRRMNESLWNNLLDYSPMREMADGLLRTLEGFNQVLESFADKPEIQRGLKNAFIESLPTYTDRNTGDDVRNVAKVGNVLSLINTLADQADYAKLVFMSSLSAVNQYGFQGGSFLPTPEDHKAALIRMNALLSKPDWKVSAKPVVEALFNGIDRTKTNDPLAGFVVHPDNVVRRITQQKSLGIVEGIHGALAVSNQQNTRIYEMLGMLIDAVRGNATAWNNLSQLEKDITAQYEVTQTTRNARLREITSVSEALPDTQMEVTEGMDKQELAVEPVDMQVTLPDIPEVQATSGFSPSTGTPTSVQNTELAAVLNSKLEMNKAAFLSLFTSSNQNGFYRLLLKRITGMLPDFKVVTLTAETIKNLPKEVVFAPGEYAKYVSLGDGSEVIYVLGEDFKNSNITHATLMHEMVHAALSRAMEDNPEFTKELQQFMAEVKAMLTPAQQKHPAFANVDEFLTYGLTDSDFQAVLNGIKFPTPKGVVEAMRSFVNILLKSLGLDARHGTALKRLITLGAEVIDKAEAAHQKETKSTIIRNISVTADKVRDYSTEDIFNALDTGAIDTGFQRHLRNVLNSVVAKLYGPYGALGKEAMRQQPMGALDVYLNGLGKQGGVFTSEILMSDVQISEQERFVAEQVEATVRAALEDNTAHTNGTYAQLARMYMEAAKRFPTPEKMIDWAKANQTEKDQAIALHKFLFDLKQTETGKSNHLARFAAMVLAVEGTSRMFGYASKNRDRTFDTSTLMGRMLTWFDSVLDWFDSRVSATYVGQRADEKVMALVTKLAEIEAKRRQRVYTRNHSKTIADTVEEGVAYLNDQTRSKVLKFSRSKVFRNSKNVYMRVAGSTLGVLSRDAIDEFGETLRKFASYASKDKTNMAAALVTELRGDTDSTSIFYKLLRGTKHIEATRQQMITNMSNMLNRSFLGHKKFGKAHNEAITTYAIRTGMYTLMDKYSLVEIEQMLSNKALLVKAIEAHEQELMTLNSTFAKFWIVAGKSLGHKMTTGVAKFQMVANPYIIARGGGTQLQDSIPTNVASQAEVIIDRLASLQAMLSGPNTVKEGADIKMGARDLMASIMREENARTDGNGIETVLKIHKKQMEESKAKLFKDSEALMVKGYSPDTLNPHVEFEVGTATEGDRYLKLGYKQVGKLSKDPNDPSKEEKFIYARKGSGLRPWQSGIFSFTSMGSRGSKQLGENLNPFTVAGNINRVALDNVLSDTQRSMSWAMKGAYTGFDPAAVKESYMVPVFNADMSVVNFRYEMTENMKDTTLERDNQFAHILGTLEGNIFDKVTSPEQNKAAAQALYDHYQANKAMDSKSFVYVGFDSQDPELAGIANMFPERTRQDIRKIWGTNGMMVRKDLLDMNFGYRKWSAAEALFQSAEEKNQFAKFIVGLFEVMFGGYDEDSKKIARERAKQWLLNKGDIWEAMVSEAKDIIVVKTGIVLLNNIMSNMLELKAFGVPALDIIRHHRTAIKASIAYRKDREELFELENLVAAGLTQGKDAEINRKIVVLKDAIVSSPVHRLMEEGLMPTIVEDVASNEDIYSRKSELVQKMQKYAKRVPAPLVKAARFTYMAHDTFLYRTLSEATQLSDFVARYTLYQHEVNKKKNPLTHDEAVRKVSDAFIPYDVPSHRKLQWGNDMGLVMFTKYYIRIQKVILRTMRDSPGNALAMLMLNQYMDSLPMLFDSGVLGDSYGGGLFGSGALELPYALDDLLTVDTVF